MKTPDDEGISMDNQRREGKSKKENPKSTKLPGCDSTSKDP